MFLLPTNKLYNKHELVMLYNKSYNVFVRRILALRFKLRLVSGFRDSHVGYKKSVDLSEVPYSKLILQLLICNFSE